MPRSSMGRRGPTRTGDEVDALSRWARRRLAYLQRAGARDSIKRGMRRRERHEARTAIRRGVEG